MRIKSQFVGAYDPSSEVQVPFMKKYNEYKKILVSQVQVKIIFQIRIKYKMHWRSRKYLHMYIHQQRVRLPIFEGKVTNL